MDMSQLPTLIFLSNVNDAPIDLTFACGVENARDLFLLLIDLFIKGVVIARVTGCGARPRCVDIGGGMRIDVDGISLSEIDFVKRKMANAGVVVKVDHRIIDADASRRPRAPLVVVHEGDGSRVEAYALVVSTRANHYRVSLELEHAHKRTQPSGMGTWV